MYGISTIIAMNRRAARTAKGKQPYIAKCDRDENVLHCPNFGDYRPKGWTLTEKHFVDKSGFGREGEPALTVDRFVSMVQKDFGYAIIEEGQFQVYVGVFERKC